MPAAYAFGTGRKSALESRWFIAGLTACVAAAAFESQAPRSVAVWVFYRLSRAFG